VPGVCQHGPTGRFVQKVLIVLFRRPMMAGGGFFAPNVVCVPKFFVAASRHLLRGLRGSKVNLTAWYVAACLSGTSGFANT
jgi:hypothetical protein